MVMRDVGTSRDNDEADTRVPYGRLSGAQRLSVVPRFLSPSLAVIVEHFIDFFM